MGNSHDESCNTGMHPLWALGLWASLLLADLHSRITQMDLFLKRTHTKTIGIFIIPAVFSSLFLIMKEDPDIKLFLIVISGMTIYGVNALKNSKGKLIPLCLIIILLSLILSYNSDFDYSIKRFNSELYPVSLHDYLTILLASVFGFISVKNNKSIFLSGCEYFSSISAILIFLDALKKESDTAYPIFLNSNWSGTLILSILPVAIHVALKILLRAFFSRKSFVRISFMVLTATFLIFVCVIDLYFLLQTGSRSASISAFVCLKLLSIYYINILMLKLRLRQSKFFLFVLVSISVGVLCRLSFIIKGTKFFTRMSHLLDSSNILRIQIYSCYLKVFKENLILGYGMGKTAQLCEEHLAKSSGTVNHAHNFMLQIGANHGIFMLLNTLLLISIYIFLCMKYLCVSIKRHQEDRMLVFSIFVTILSLALASCFQASIYHVPFLQLWIGLLSGGSVAVATLKNSNHPRKIKKS